MAILAPLALQGLLESVVSLESAANEAKKANLATQEHQGMTALMASLEEMAYKDFPAHKGR